MLPHRIRLAPARIAAVLGGLIFLLVVLHYVGVFHRVLVGEGFLSYSFAPKFNLDGEQTVPAFFSSLLLLGASLVLMTIASDPRTTVRRVHWWLLGALFALLAVDEAAGFHELLTMPLRSRLDLPGWLYFAWVIPAAAFVLLFAVAYLPFLLALPRRYGVLFTLAGVLYVGGALGVEVLSAASWGTAVYQVVMPLEEVLEMAGMVVFLYALLAYKGEHGSPMMVEIGRAPAGQPNQAGASS